MKRCRPLPAPSYLRACSTVRHRFVTLVARWMTSLPDRADWWPRLFPYLLSALTDTTPLPPAASHHAVLHALPTPDLGYLSPEARRLGSQPIATGGASDAAGGRVCDVAITALEALGLEHEREHMAALLDRVQLGVDGDTTGEWWYLRQA